MCLGIPGKIIEINHQRDELLMGKVSFDGLVKEVCLSYVPEAQIGDYVIVHVGFAISIVEEQEARQVFDYLNEIDDTDGLED